MATQINKVPIVMQDLAIGRTPISQSRAGSTYTVNPIDVPVAVNSTAELTTLDVNTYQYARVYTSASKAIEYLYDPSDFTGIPSSGPGTWVVSANDAAVTITLAQAQASDLRTGQYLRIIDRALGLFRVDRDVPTNDIDNIDLGNGFVAVSVYEGWLNPAWWGANNNTDSSTVFARIDELGVPYVNLNGLEFYSEATCKFSNKVILINGKLRSKNTDANTPALWVQGDGSGVDWLEIDGLGVETGETYPTLAFSNSGIRVSKEITGANNFVNNVYIGDSVTISNMRGEGVLVSHVVGCKLGSPTIKNCGYAGILGLSVIDSTIDSPNIDTIHDKDNYVNHYGITLTRNLTANLVDDPKSTNVQVGRPIIKNVLNWIGFDIHAGVNISTDFVRCYKCKLPFNIQYDSANAGLRNAPENVTLNGYGESFDNETSGIGCAVLGLSDSKPYDITLNVRLKNCGDVSGSQTGALLVSNVDGIKGKVQLIGSKRVGFSLVGTNNNVKLEVNQKGVTWTGGSTFYLYTDAATQTDIRIKGNWGFNTAGTLTGANIGIFYTGVQASEGDILFDKVRMKLSSGTTWLSNGTNINRLDDFSWTIENETIALTGQTTVGGVQYDQFLGDLSSQFKRVPDLYPSNVTPEWSLYNQVVGAFDLGIRTFTNNTSPAIYKFDGTNVPASQTINVSCNLRGVFFND